MEVRERLAALRRLMKEQGLDAYIVPGNDPHASEYMAPHWAEMSWLTGFLGETGTAVVTAEKALLWTDSRYYLQAEAELAGSTIELMRESDVDCPSISQWIISNFKFQVSGSPVVAVNPEMYSVNDYATLRKELGESGIKLRSADLIAPIWIEGRPEIPMNPLYIYDDRYAGETVTDKLLRVREALAERGAEAAIIAELGMAAECARNRCRIYAVRDSLLRCRKRPLHAIYRCKQGVESSSRRVVDTKH